MSVRNEEKRELKAILHKEDPKFWGSLKEEDRNKVLKMVTSAVSSVTFQQSTSVYSGPIPSPEMLDEYNKIMPNGADRIMSMAEEQSRHRMKLESQTISSQNKQGERGQIFALISVLALIGGGIWVCALGHPGVGVTIFGTTILGIGGVFAYGKYAIRRSLTKKSNGN